MVNVFKELQPETKLHRSTYIIASLLAGAGCPAPSFSTDAEESVEPEMIFVEGGTFSMGGSSEQGNECKDTEKPAHTVTVGSFNIGKYPVTQKQWQAVMGNNPSGFSGENNPVESVSWNDVHEYLRRLNEITGKQYRLPTEAEWEYAARGGGKSKCYKYSGSDDVKSVAWYKENSDESTHPVGEKQPNELGIYDMSGNVWEWCYDWFGAYHASEQSDPTGPQSGSYRIYRGGSCYAGATVCRVSYRYGNIPNNSLCNLGFRVVF